MAKQSERISPLIRAKLEALPDRAAGQKRTVWTREMDALLLAGWRKKRQKDVAHLLDLNINTCRARFEYLLVQQAAGKAVRE